MNKYTEKILGVYEEDIEKLDRDFLKKEFPLSAIFTFAMIAYPILSFLSMYFSVRGIAHIDKRRKLYFRTLNEEIEEKERFMEKLKDYEPKNIKIEW